jgi:Zn finger protein HypA/HybF involved in hydrogenase expression
MKCKVCKKEFKEEYLAEPAWHVWICDNCHRLIIDQGDHVILNSYACAPLLLHKNEAIECFA